MFHRDFGDEHLDFIFGAATEGDGTSREIQTDWFFARETHNEGEGVF